MTSDATDRDPGPFRRMTARDRGEAHRAATPLELFFDLCFVVAVAQAGGQLAHDLAEGRVGHGLYGYAFAFFAIWWAWMNFSWFASAYDVDDVPYRLTTLVQITGVLILAAGVPRMFADQDLTLSVLGYVVMRLAMVTQWLRAAAAETGAARTMALRYVVGITVCQIGWGLILLVPEDALPYVLPLGILAELSVPAIAELRTQSTWHPQHIAERYGLFTLIVLGETVSAATLAVQAALDEHEALGELLPIAAGGLLLCFAAWWIYFVRPIHDHLRSNRQAFLWGYGHYPGARLGRRHRRRPRSRGGARGRLGPHLGERGHRRGDGTRCALPVHRLAAALPARQARRGPGAAADRVGGRAGLHGGRAERGPAGRSGGRRDGGRRYRPGRQGGLSCRCPVSR
ncbi:hypothetical protein GCM10010193_58620 [Kitasatospora atroaurantiaca]|uniref:Low temperature requirement A protein (LtrA) n=1 Tax=Kitasatospora atroaurantiaca TaxID=285545 RepID=A0A561EP85_9ACTN|nr:low temperature requirement A protein (LtrA) [Kitasatospora atroaurantiaca]